MTDVKDIFAGFNLAYVDDLMAIYQKPIGRTRNYAPPTTYFFPKAFNQIDVGLSRGARTTFAIGQKEKSTLFHMNGSVLTMENVKPALVATKLKRYGYGEATGTHEIYLQAPTYFVYIIPGNTSGSYSGVHIFYVEDVDIHYKPLFGEALNINPTGNDSSSKKADVAVNDLKALVGRILDSRDLINKLSEINLDNLGCKCKETQHTEATPQRVGVDTPNI